MTHASLFSGIGGAELAASWMGWDNVFHCEINPFGRNETEYKLLFMTIYENIKQLESVGQLHSNTLVNADCLEAMKYIADKSIDMVLCDLPYG
mgnify:FL=1